MKAIPIIFLIIIGLLEVLLDLSVGFSVALYIVLFTAILLIYSRLDDYEGLDKFTLVLALIPLMKIIELLVDLEEHLKSIFLYSIFLFLTIYYIVKFEVRLGFNWREFVVLPLVLVIGGLMGVLGSLFIEFPSGYTFLTLIFIGVICEELFFRGLMQNIGNDIFGRGFSIAFVCVLYAVLASGFNPLLFGAFLMVSIFSSVIYDSYKNILLPIVLNLTIMLIIYLI